MSVINYLKKVQLPNETEYTVKDPTFFTGTTAEWNLLSTEEKKTYQIVNLTDDEEEGDISGKADKVTGATAGNFAGLDANGNLTDSGHKHSDYLTQHQDISGKADKVSSATNGNIAGLNASGNLTDSGISGDMTTQSATGNPISIPNLKSAQIALNPVITFEPIQSGSGTPSPSNIRAISGYDKIEVSSCQKNLFDSDQLLQANGWSKSNGVYSGNITDLIVKFGSGFNTPKFKANTQYTISYYGWVADISTNRNFRFVFNYTDGTSSQVAYNNYTTKTYITGTSTSGKTVASIGCTYGSSIAMYLQDIQLEEGASATTYVPYHKTTDLSESLGQTVYGGTYEPRTGLFTVTHKGVDMGSLTYTFNSTYQFFSTDSLSDRKYGVSIGCISSCYNEIYDRSAEQMFSVASGNIASNNNTVIIKIKNTDYTDPTAFKTAMTGQKIVYELATPFTIQLTPHEIALSQGYNYISTNGTSISLAYHNGELATHADVEQLAETVNALPNFFLPDYANALSVHSGALEINSSYSEYTAPQNGYIIIAEMYGAVDTSSTPFSPPYFDIRIEQKRIFSTQAFLATNERASGTIIPIAKGSLFQYRVTNKKLNELIIWFAPIKYV